MPPTRPSARAARSVAVTGWKRKMWPTCTMRRAAEAAGTRRRPPAAEADEQDVHRRALLLDEIAAEVLGDFVVEHAGFHPAHDEEIGGGDEDAVQHAVLGLSEAARSVAHRYLEHAIAAHLQQRR